MNPALTERLMGIARHAQTLGHGGKTDYLRGAAAELGWSMDKLYRHLKQVSVQAPRKRRADAGNCRLSLDEARLISAAVLEGARKNGKRIMTIERAAQMLRANGMIEAHQVDEDGVCTPLSAGTLARALREYGLHPDQLLQPDPITRLKSLHPNHVWQIDPSLCVLYYLPHHGKDSGLRVAGHDEFYKNKPKNLQRILNDRVWRYVVTDHTSGCLFVRYVFGGETSENLCDALIAAMQPKEDVGLDPFRGVPKMVMLDPGSANTSASFKNLCAQLGIHVQINKPGNPRAKGQVENANNLVETAFESGLRFVAVEDIDSLNALARRWMRYYNGTQTHSRHGLTRYQAWNRIQSEELILPPPADYCRELAVSAPKEVKVSPYMEIKFGGRVYSVAHLPGVIVAQKLMAAKNPWRKEACQVALFDEAGREIWHVLEPMAFDEAGFASDAAVIGAEYKDKGDTRAVSERKALDKTAMQAATEAEAAAKRKARALPFGGAVDPYKHQEDTLAARNILYAPRQGVQMDYNRKEVAETVLNKVELAKRLKPRIEAAGGNWAQAVKILQTQYPNGVAESELENVFERLHRAGTLKIIKGGGA